MSENKDGFYVNKAFQIIPDDAEDQFKAYSTEDELAVESRDNLLLIFKGVFGSVSPIDGKKTQKALAKEIWREVHRETPAENTAGTSTDAGAAAGSTPPAGKSNKKEKPPAAPRKTPQAQLARDYFGQHHFCTQEKLAEVIGSDTRNAHTLISIMRNDKRTKDPVNVLYDKKNKTYYWPSEEGKKLYSEAMKKQEEEAANAAKAAAEAKAKAEADAKAAAQAKADAEAKAKAEAAAKENATKE